MIFRTTLGTGFIFAAACAFAQTPPATPAMEFEAASIKPSAPMAMNKIMVRMGGDPGRINYNGVSLRDLIRVAYQLKDYQITGPEWLNSERFDVVAKVPEGAKESDKPALLQNMLAQRFKLTIHREKKDLPAFALVVAKGGPKMKEFVEKPEDANGPSAGGEPPMPKRGPDGTMKMPGGRGGMVMMGNGRMQAQGVPISNLIDILSRQLDRPVVDETGLTAKYDISLNWTPEAGEGGGGMKMMMRDGGGGDGRDDSQVANNPPLPVALQQQLGLRLEPKKLPLEMVVVDHIEKVPTEN